MSEPYIPEQIQTTGSNSHRLAILFFVLLFVLIMALIGIYMWMESKISEEIDE